MNFKANNPTEAATALFPKAQIETFDDGRIAFARSEHSGKHSAAMFKGTKFAPTWHYSFRSVEAMERHIENAKATALSAATHRAARRAEVAEKSAAFVQPYQVGDILYNSWGYDQTNVGFYQVVALHGKRGVTLRELCQRNVEGSEGFMCERVLPVPGKFIQDRHRDEQTGETVYTDREPMRKIVSNDGYVNIYGASYGQAHKWDGQPMYQSHYA